MTPQSPNRARVPRRGSSFYYSLLTLTMEQREALTTLYGFLREIVDIGEARPDTPGIQAKLEWWREEVERLFARRAQHPSTRALSPLVDAFGLQAGDFREIIEAVVTAQHVRIMPSFPVLAQYCQGLGSAPLRLGATLVGRDRGRDRGFTDAMGLFLQLLRILRRVRQDVSRGRIFLPQDEMQRFGVAPEDLFQGRTNETTRALFRWQAERLRTFQGQAFAALPAADRYRQRQAIALAEMASAVLDEIEADGFRLTKQHITLTPLRKLWITGRVMRRERRYQRRH